MYALLPVLLLFGQAAQSPNPFLKTTDDANGLFSLSTAAHRLTAPGKPDVWLVGAAHIGTKAYYAGIQKLLDAQAEVLYEGVKRGSAPPKAAPPPAKAGDGKPIYQVLSDALGLDFQLTDIDYQHPNWIDSDLSMDDLDKLNKAAGGGKATQFNLIERLLDPNSQMAAQFKAAIKTMPPGTLEGLKLFMVKRLSTMDPGSILGDPTTAEVVLKARNASVEAYFAKAIAGPNPPSSIAIFYGALHQAAIEGDLAAKYGYKVAEQRWFKVATADKRKVDAQGQVVYSVLEAQYGKAQGKPKP